jgi:hypothetical protein
MMQEAARMILPFYQTLLSRAIKKFPESVGVERNL